MPLRDSPFGRKPSLLSQQHLESEKRRLAEEEAAPYKWKPRFPDAHLSRREKLALKQTETHHPYPYKKCPTCDQARFHCVECGYPEECRNCNSEWVLCVARDETDDPNLETNWHGVVEDGPESTPASTSASPQVPPKEPVK